MKLFYYNKKVLYVKYFSKYFLPLPAYRLDLSVLMDYNQGYA